MARHVRYTISYSKLACGMGKGVDVAGVGVLVVKPEKMS